MAATQNTLQTNQINEETLGISLPIQATQRQIHRTQYTTKHNLFVDDIEEQLRQVVFHEESTDEIMSGLGEGTRACTDFPEDEEDNLPHIGSEPLRHPNRSEYTNDADIADIHETMSFRTQIESSEYSTDKVSNFFTYFM